MKNLLSTLLLATTLIGAAQAAPINQRQWNQQHRINQGIRSGNLTPREANHLEHREAKLNYREQRMRANGLSPMERARLQRQENRLSRDIYNKKHNGRTW